MNKKLAYGPTHIEREQFSQRLSSAVTKAGIVPSPTRLSRAFNAGFDGPPVTVHAARKWLVGEAIPTQPKLRVLAELVGVPVEWLRFGDSANMPELSVNRVSLKNIEFMSNIEALSDHDRSLVEDFVRLLVSRKRNTPTRCDE